MLHISFGVEGGDVQKCKFVTDASDFSFDVIASPSGLLRVNYAEGSRLANGRTFILENEILRRLIAALQAPQDDNKKWGE